MRMLGGGAGFILGAVVGFAGLRLLTPPGVEQGRGEPARTVPREHAVSSRPSHPVQAHAEEACADVREEIQGLRSQLDELEQRALTSQPTEARPEVKKGASDPRCMAVQWPSSTPEQFKEANVHELLADQLKGRDFELDCSEFPCLAVIEDSAVDGVQLDALKARLPGGTFVELSSVAPGPTGARHVHFFAPLPPGTDSEEVQERIQGRISAVQLEHQRETNDAQGRPESFEDPSPPPRPEWRP